MMELDGTSYRTAGMDVKQLKTVIERFCDVAYGGVSDDIAQIVQYNARQLC